MVRQYALIVFLVSLCGPAFCESGALFSLEPRGSLFASTPNPARSSLIPTKVTPDSAGTTAGNERRGSLFVGVVEGSLLAPYQDLVPQLERSRLGPSNTPIRDKIRDVIALAEAGPAGYNAVIYAAKVNPRKPPTRMTLREIYQWIAATPNQHHAIGRYQFIPKTLKRLATKAGIAENARFSPEVQDKLADILLDEAGFEDMVNGQLAVKNFQNNLAKIWAGLPLENGKSYYQGHAGNRATITRAQFDAKMGNLF